MYGLRRLFAGLLACMLSVGTSQGADRALLIGIDKYPKLRSLVGSKNDVKNMRHFILADLGYQPEQVKTLLDSEATRVNILSTLRNWLLEGTRPGERVFFYYSGHGYRMPDADGDEEDKYDETLVSYDTYADERDVLHNMISDDELGDLFVRLDDREVVVIIDSCHSGTITRGLFVSEDEQYHKTLTPSDWQATRSLAIEGEQQLEAHRQENSLLPASDKRAVWSAVGAAQIAFVDKEADPHGGVFTRRFLDGIQRGQADHNRDGVVSNAELLDYVRSESHNYCERHKKKCGLGLTPALEIESDYWGKPALQFEIAAPTPPTAELASQVLAHDNQAEARLELLPDSTFKLREEMAFRITSPRSGYLIVLDVNARGEMVQLFPNRFSDQSGQGNRIDANRPVTIPGKHYDFIFEAVEPVGKGHLFAIISEDPVHMDDLLASHKSLDIIDDPPSYLTNLAERLRQIWKQDRFNRQTEWSLVETNYEIVP